jgi:hypothetical protein
VRIGCTIPTPSSQFAANSFPSPPVFQFGGHYLQNFTSHQLANTAGDHSSKYRRAFRMFYTKDILPSMTQFAISHCSSQQPYRHSIFKLTCEYMQFRFL